MGKMVNHDLRALTWIFPVFLFNFNDNVMSMRWLIRMPDK
jgi:hypothetical protein